MRLLLALATLLLASVPALADPTVVATSPWARATAGQGTVGAAYVTLASPDGDRLIAAESPVAGSVEIHEHSMDGGVMKMRQVQGIDLAPGESVTLKPGGYHLMLLDLKQKLVAGQSFPLTLVFQKAGRVAVTVPILGPGASGPAGAMDHMDHMKGMDMGPADKAPGK